MDESIIHSLGSAAIEWSHLSGAVLKKEYSETLPEDRNPTSHAELLFWKNGSAPRTLHLHYHMSLQDLEVELIVSKVSAGETNYFNFRAPVLSGEK